MRDGHPQTLTVSCCSFVLHLSQFLIDDSLMFVLNLKFWFCLSWLWKIQRTNVSTSTKQRDSKFHILPLLTNKKEDCISYLKLYNITYLSWTYTEIRGKWFMSILFLGYPNVSLVLYLICFLGKMKFSEHLYIFWLLSKENTIRSNENHHIETEQDKPKQI